MIFRIIFEIRHALISSILKFMVLQRVREIGMKLWIINRKKKKYKYLGGTLVFRKSWSLHEIWNFFARCIFWFLSLMTNDKILKNSTAPDPPSNLTVTARNGKSAIVSWAPPAQGNYTGFRLRVQSFSDAGSPRTSVIPADAVPYTLRDLTPGATYSLQLFTVLGAKESVAYTSRNFTTSNYVNFLKIIPEFCQLMMTNISTCFSNRSLIHPSLYLRP